jgi:hypothetical protein
VSEVRKGLDEIRAELAKDKSVVIENTYDTDSATAQADATVRAQRRQAALGLFG